MRDNIVFLLVLGTAIRYYLSTTEHAETIGNRVEIATPLNSFKRMQEGVYLYKRGINPYDGDMVHEIPLLLHGFLFVLDRVPHLIPLSYILVDLLTAVILYKLSQNFVYTKLKEQKSQIQSYADNTFELQIQKSDLHSIPRLVLIAYVFNPLVIMNCIGLTSTVFSNLLLSLVLYGLCNRWLLLCLVMLAVEAMRNLYPIVLIAPIVLSFGRSSLTKSFAIVLAFAGCCGAVAWLNFLLINSWNFIDGTLGFIFFYRDLQPNIGLFWYFFTEMFEHFRTMFLITFQMNATVLYLLPLTLKLRKEPMLLATVLIGVISVFRSYPCLGDVSFYLALLPLWKRCWKFMAHNFVVFCFFLITLPMMAALWHLWIYAGSANANFYFGATLAFSTGQIFLITDLLFAYVKREFCLYNGQKIFIDGREAKIILE